MTTTLKVQYFLNCETTKYSSKEKECYYFLTAPFATVPAASFMGYVSASLVHLSAWISAHYSKPNCFTFCFTTFTCMERLPNAFLFYSVSNGFFSGHYDVQVCGVIHLKWSYDQMSSWQLIES